MTDNSTEGDMTVETAVRRIDELEQRLAQLEENYSALGEQTTHLIALLGETRRELRETWAQRDRDVAEGRG